jgi:hypothetical protein
MKIYPTLKDVQIMPLYILKLIYENGECRLYDFSSNLTHPYYSQLKDTLLFQQVTVLNGELYWKTGQDFCPHTLYELSSPL